MAWEERVASAQLHGTSVAERSWQSIVGNDTHRFVNYLQHAFRRPTCPSGAPSRRIGNSGDGGWTICRSSDLDAHGCTILSIGIGDDDSFDHGSASLFPQCSVAMVDPTPSVVKRYSGPEQEWRSTSQPNLRFVPWGLAAADAATTLNNVYTSYTPTAPLTMLTLRSIRQRLGWSIDQPITLLKIDIEGFEWLELQLNASEPANRKLRRAETHATTLLPELLAQPAGFLQLAIELHSGTPRIWQDVIDSLEQRGFLLRAVNGARMHGGRMPLAEFTFLRSAAGRSTSSPLIPAQPAAAHQQQHLHLSMRNHPAVRSGPRIGT